MQTITVAEVAEALDQIIIERGHDFVYDQSNGCFYSKPDGTPDCAVGAILAKIAPDAFQTLAVLESETDDGNGVLCRREAGSVLKFIAGGEDAYTEARFSQYHVVRAETPALHRALTALQSSQDQGDTWGRGRELFLETLRRSLVPA